METNLVIEGMKFMLLGMGTVFSFLIIMILCMNAMSKIVHKFFPEPQASADVNTTSAPAQDKKKIVAAITAAIKYHREG
ncbi:OadG family protein [Sulfurimonas sp. C5]|uniref:OadG family protein n=1 Tax=Sulfurimonas sp. C5 TaxID=3036947 RepID=UPI0024555D1A|nr:OadG family protein [Sulfurimonas sp. C5]MDH4944179.1 OadG family protein [Sulfurimonas sp. C5]